MAVVDSLADSSGERRRLGLSSPTTLQPLGAFEVRSAADVAAALERARKAQSDWAALPIGVRARTLRKALRVLLERLDAFADVIVRETGKPHAEALAHELLPACDMLATTTRNAARVLADRSVPLHLAKTKKLRICHRPLGVVGIITPCNFPFLLAANPSFQALVAGNAVLLKPSEAAPASARLLEELFQAAGLPEGLFQVLLGDAETGAALVDAGVDKIVFTGSVANGRRVAEACARRLLPCTLELGGKDAMIVCADADVARAARGAVVGAFANAGQVCASVERVYVVEDVADEFTRHVVEQTARLRQGPEGEFEIGPMIRPEQLAVVERHVRDALEHGARLLAGGRRNPAFEGLFYEPTVLVDVDHEMLVMREETFGPVLPIMRVRDEQEALALANDSSYGLGTSIWTRDRHRALELARAVESGSVVVNDCLVTYGVTEAPFGGRKQSGIGQVNGEAGLRSYCHAQSVLVDRLGTRSEWLWFPYSLRKTRRLRRVARWIWGTPLGRLLS